MSDTFDDPFAASARLIAAHPSIFRTAQARASVGIPAGWYTLVDDVLGRIERLLGDRVDAFTVRQIKSKFAGLRLYWSLDVPEPPGAPLPPEVTEHAGGIRVRPRSRHALKQQIEALVAAAEQRSIATCEWCGEEPARIVVGGSPAGARRWAVSDGIYHTACARCRGDALAAGNWRNHAARADG